MKTRRAFLKTLSFFIALVVPWTILPQKWRQSLNHLAGRPIAEVDVAEAAEEDTIGIAPEVLSRKGFEDIQALCQPGMQGRRAGTDGETRTLVYLKDQLEALKLEPFGDEGFFQKFSIPSMAERVINGRALFRPQGTNTPPIPSTNLLGGLKGMNQEESIIISAHYDHLGIYQGELHRGANDNASGVGCVLEVMRRLVSERIQGTIPRINVVAVFWGAEEMGLLGSNYFVKNPTIPLSNISAVINFDTISRGDSEEFILWSKTDGTVISTIMNVGSRLGARIEKTDGNGHKSDDVSFQGTSIPAVTVLSKDWLLNNHTKEDDISNISEKKFELACNILYYTVKEVAY